MSEPSKLNGFARRVVRARKELDLSQEKFAELGGVKLSSQQQYEAAKTAPSINYLYELWDAGVDIAELLTGEPASGELDPVDRQTLAMLNELSVNDRAVVFSLLCVLTERTIGADDLAAQLARAQGQRDFAQRFAPATLHDKAQDFGGFPGEVDDKS